MRKQITSEHDLLVGLRERRDLLERLVAIQRSISHGVPLQEVLDAITAGAAQLHGDVITALRLVDRDDPAKMVLVSSVGLDERQLEQLRHARVGEGVGGQAIARDELVVEERYASAPGTIPLLAEQGLQAAMAAPVHDGATVIGGLVVASFDEGRRYSRSEQEILLAFAEHASLALTDARLIEERERLARRHEQERFGALVQHSRDLIFVIDPEGVVTYASPSADALLGRRLVGTPFAELLHPDTRGQVQGPPGFPAPDRGSPAGEWRLLGGGDEAIAVEVVVTDLVDHPRIGGWVLNARDVTARRRLEERQRAAEARYRLIVETTSEGIWLLDEEGCTRFVNPAAERLTGRGAGELLGRPPSAVLDADAARRVEPLLARDETGRGDVDIATPSGRRRRLRVTVTPLRDGGGARTGSMLLMSDITDLVRARADKAELEERLRRAQKVESIGLLASQIAHDFNNVLSVVLGTSDLALRALDPDHPVADHVRRIAEGARLGVDISGRLLSYGRPERGEPLLVDLGALVASTLGMLRDAVPAGVEVREELERGIPVLADPVHIHQLVMNLVDNAVDATAPAGEVVVRTREERRGDERRAVLEVCDTGSGMDADLLARATEPLVTTKARGRGTGFGLSIVSGIVERSGGRLDLRSAPGEGTTVTVSLPAADEAPGADAPAPEAPAGDQAGQTVLLVEDDPLVRDMTRRILVHHGFEVVEAAAAEEALALAGRPGVRFDVILTDQTMRGMSGLALLQALRDAGHDAPGIVMSGYAVGDALEDVTTTPTAWLHKPFGGEALVSALRAALRSPA